MVWPCGNGGPGRGGAGSSGRPDGRQRSQRINMLRKLFISQNPVTDKADALIRPPINVRAPLGAYPDDMDRLRMGGYEDPAEWEEAMKRAYVEAKTDAEVDQLLKTHYLEEDVAASFAAYRNSGVTEVVDELLMKLGVGRQAPIADIGCGRGHAAHAMYKLGYANMTAMDPNDKWYTGTGYLQSLSDHTIRVVNCLDEWNQLGGRFGAITGNTYPRSPSGHDGLCNPVGTG
jgi:hypothetical protein